MAGNLSVQYNGGLLLDIILFDPTLLPSGNSFKYHVVAVFTVCVTVYYYYHV